MEYDFAFCHCSEGATLQQTTFSGGMVMCNKKVFLQTYEVRPLQGK